MTHSTPSAIRLIACPHPLSVEKGRIDELVPEGATVREHLRAFNLDPEALNALVFIDDERIAQAQWEYAVPRAGQNLSVRAIPAGGGGGSEQGKSALRIVAMLAVVVASIFTAGGALAGVLGAGFGAGTFGAAFAGAALSIAGSLAINALIPPSRQLDDGFGAGAANPSFRITGTRNQFIPFGVLPQVLGRHRIFPPYAAKPFTEIVGDTQYFRALFTCGLGPLALSDFKIGETPIEQFNDVEMEVRYGYAADEPITIFPDDVAEDNLSILLSYAGGWQQRTSQANAKELSVDITFPEGLGIVNRNGSVGGRQVSFSVEYRQVGTVGWTVANDVPGVAAAGGYAWDGANNDLVITATVTGTDGNGILFSFYAGSALEVTVDESGRNFFVTLVDGVTTASAVAAALTAVSGGLFTVSNAPGNDGTGVVNLPVTDAGYSQVQLHGGLNYVPSLLVTNNSLQPFAASIRWVVPVEGAQYEVRIARLNVDSNDADVHDVAYWTTLRTIQVLDPTSLQGQCLIAMRIRATDQLNGQLDEFNCLAQTVCPDWDGTRWVMRPTNQVAALYRHVLQGPANAKPKADARLDLTTIQAFADRCRANGFTFNAVIDQRTSVRQLRQDILAAGRGLFGMRDMLYSVVEDLPQSIPVQVVTPRNSWEMSGTKLFVNLPHGRKVRFLNEEKNFASDERVLPLDGYGVTGTDHVRRDAFGMPTSNPEASIFETVDAGVGVTNPTQVFVLERYNQAVAVLRSESFTVNQDIELLRCLRGDRVDVNHDVLLAGLVSARVKSVTTDGGGNVTAFTIDDVLTMVSGTTYGVRFRRSDGSQTIALLTTVAGTQSSFSVPTPISSATKPAVGDLAMFGEYGQETMPCLVRAILPGPDLTGRLMLVPYAPGVQVAATGVIPPFESHVTVPSLAREAPPQPIVQSVQSDETVLARMMDGSLESRILITLSYASGFTVPAVEVQVQMRESLSVAPWRQLRFSPNDRQLVVTGVSDGATYDLMIRAVGAEGQTSDWTYVNAHTVVGKTTPPPDVTGLAFDSEGIRWSYPDPPADLAGFLIRVRPGLAPVWDDAFQLNDIPVGATTYPVIPDGSTRIIMVKAVDVAGNESATAAWILQDAAALVLDNLAEAYDLQALGFPGTLTNCSVVANELTANSLALFWSNDSALFWSSDSALFWNGSYADMTYVFTVTPPVKWLAGTIRTQLGISAQGWTLEYRQGSTALFWSSDSALFWSSDAALMWSAENAAFTTWPGALERPKRQEYEFRLSAVGGTIQGVVSLLRVLYDMPDLHEAFADLALPVGGARIPLTKTFQVITAVAATPRYDGGALTRLQTYDLQLSPGPLLIGYDADGVLAGGVAGGTVDGY